MLNNQNTQFPAPRVPVVDKQFLMERSWYRFFSNFYNYFVDLPYGSFYDTTIQTVAANTPKAITFNSTGFAQHTQIGTPSSKIQFFADGLTTVTISIQFTNSSATQDDAYVWLSKNGSDIPFTASTVTVAGKHGSIDGAALITVNFYENFNPGDYLEVYWLSVNGTTSITTIPASVSPAKPASPGVVLTVSQII
jgi:hypothetical protein